MTNKTSVSKEIYKFLLQYREWCPSGYLETQHFLQATGSTITRKSRLLEQDRWIAVRYVDGCAEYRALRTEAERDAYIPEKTLGTPNLASRDEIPEVKPKVKYVPVFDGKSPRPVAMRAVPV